MSQHSFIHSQIANGRDMDDQDISYRAYATDDGALDLPASGNCRVPPSLPPANTNDALMAALARGDVKAFSEIVDRHLPAVYRLSHRLLGDASEAEDVSQECFARLWQNAANWRPVGGGLPAWLHRVASNLCFDRLRHGKEIATSPLPEISDERPTPLQQAQSSELNQQITICLTRLSPRHRAALALSYFEGYSNVLAAQIMDMNLKAFESLLHRARQQMCRELGEAGIMVDDIGVLA